MSSQRTTRQTILSRKSTNGQFGQMRRLTAPKISCLYVQLAATFPAGQHFGFDGRLSRRTILRLLTFSSFYFSYFSFFIVFIFSLIFLSLALFILSIFPSGVRLSQLALVSSVELLVQACLIFELYWTLDLPFPICKLLWLSLSYPVDPFYYFPWVLFVNFFHSLLSYVPLIPLLLFSVSLIKKFFSSFI